MPRRRKTEHEKAQRREVYATADEWEEVKSAAERAGLTVSRLLVFHCRAKRAPDGRAGNMALQIARIQGDLEMLAATLPPSTPGAALVLARAAAIEKQLAALAGGGAR